MSEWLTIEQSVGRNEKGDLIPEEVIVEFMNNKPKILAIPISRSKMRMLGAGLTEEGHTTRTQDERIILEHVLQPKYTPEVLKDMSQKTMLALTYAIMSISTGMSQEDIRSKTMRTIVDEEDLKKKS